MYVSVCMHLCVCTMCTVCFAKRHIMSTASGPSLELVTAISNLSPTRHTNMKMLGNHKIYMFTFTCMSPCEAMLFPYLLFCLTCFWQMLSLVSKRKLGNNRCCTIGQWALYNLALSLVQLGICMKAIQALSTVHLGICVRTIQVGFGEKPQPFHITTWMDKEPLCSTGDKFPPSSWSLDQGLWVPLKETQCLH